MSKTVYDAMVVGAGASGIFAARELTAQGLKVVLLEAGPEIGPQHFDPGSKTRQTEINLWQRARATLAGQGVQARAAFFNAQLRHLYVDDRKNPYTTPPDAPFVWIRGRQAGGRTHTFGRVLLRWTDDDFKLQSRTGRGVDWPIAYADVAPFYEEVERNLGLYGNVDNVPTLPDGAYLGEAKLTPAEQLFKAEVEAKWPERRVTSWRFIGHEPSRVLRPLREAIASGNLAVRYDTIVRRIVIDEATGRASGAEVLDRRTGAISTILAASVVLCASPVETIRLLLNSATSRQPEGLANSSGLLGRYFMDQLPSIAAGTFPKAKGWAAAESAPADPFYPATGGIFMPRFVGEDGKTAASDFDFQGTVGRAAVGEEAPSRLSFFGFGMMSPNLENRVTLDPQRKDAWGIPVPHIRCRMSELDRATLQRQIAAITETVEGVGGELEFVGSPLGLEEKGRGAYPEADPFSRFMFRRMFRRTMVMGAAIHETGGARMGTGPDNSVLNSFNQSWDIPNLVITDASAFAGSGVSGTTLTIMALTVRACRHLAGVL